jgi:hypothetical protein
MTSGSLYPAFVAMPGMPRPRTLTREAAAPEGNVLALGNALDQDALR